MENTDFCSAKLFSTNCWMFAASVQCNGRHSTDEEAGHEQGMNYRLQDAWIRSLSVVWSSGNV